MGWEVGFDCVGDDVYGGLLGCGDQVNVGGMGYLCQVLDGGFDFFVGDYYQICYFVDDDDDVGYFFGFDGFGFEDWFVGFFVVICLYSM